MPVEATNEIAAVLVAEGDRYILTYISRIETGRAQPPFRLILAIAHQLDKAVGINRGARI